MSDPQNPDNLYAALYARRRTPWSFVAEKQKLTVSVAPGLETR